MGELSDAIELARYEVSQVAYDILPDLLTIYARSDGSNGEVSEDYEQTSLDVIPCSYEALNAYERPFGGTTAQGATHKIKMPVTEETMAISGSYRLVVQERGMTPELTFEVTGRLDSSSDLFLMVAATLKG